MSNLREAAQQALEALYQAREHVTVHTDGPWQRVENDCHVAITALRAALAEPVQEPVQEPYCYVYEYDAVFGLHREFYPRPYNGMKPSRTVPVYAHPPQRHLPDWISYDKTTDVLNIHGKKYAAAIFGEEGFLSPTGTVLRVEQSQPETVTLTAPPQRKPLRDEEILSVLRLAPSEPSLWPHLKDEAVVGDVQKAVLAIARAIEEAHGII